MTDLKPQNRGGTWYLVRRVPKAFAHVDPRRFVKMTTGVKVVDDPRGVRAARILAGLNERLEGDWADMIAGRDPKGRRDYDRARTIATSLGIAYATASDLAVGPIADIIKRVTVLERERGLDSEKVFGALMGAAERPPMMLSDLPTAFEETQSASIQGMSDEQVYRWRLNKKRAVRNIRGIIGDKSVLELTREDGISVRRHFQKRVTSGEITVNTANIEMGHFTRMLRSVETERQIGIPLSSFANLRIEGGEERQRPAFPVEFIQKRILAEGALDGLTAEARRIVYVMVETGMRPSEIANLTPGQIHLDAKVPHVSVRPDGRRLKTKPSLRDMPLVGCALAAMKLQPEGFASYREKGSLLSSEVNDYLKSAALRPTPEHTMYGLRHSFEDRLTAVDAPDKIIGRLMGHKGYREKYGDGPSLEHLQGWLEQIAFKSPSAL